MHAQPLVSCIMPTANRRVFVPWAIEYFLRQDYRNKELVIVDDGTDVIEDLVPVDTRIRYLRLPVRHRVGAKRNLACEMASGDIVAHWDDDDWHAPHRLCYQVDALVRGDAQVCGITNPLFFDIHGRRAWQYTYARNQRFWLSGSTLCYTREFWLGHRFADIDVGEDARFVWSGEPGRMVALADPSFHVGMIHRHNVSPKRTSGSSWHPYPVEELLRVLGDDSRRYHEQRGSAPPATPESTVPPRDSLNERKIAMMTCARTDDLQLPEFTAFRAGQSLPRMRTWELPFALFQARLANTAAILDCTINPTGFQERIHGLYPHASYRHWNPIQGGRFVTPLGVPDEAFDQVFCINTLEHLLKPQREQLLAAIARKLKPSGRLVITCDYYFESSWKQPEFINAGVMRSDRQEVFNGFNKVEPAELMSLCKASGLVPAADVWEAPREADSTLLRQNPPFPHACIAGVFSKLPANGPAPGKKVLLALLTWNTRDVSRDSIRAYVREAHLLKRLGLEPLLCVCDNGSTDGTVEAIRDLEPMFDFPYTLIFNKENLGNSVARNQIIDYLMESGADYLLFMDGDIEVVPFSSFAMFRYMENQGSRLGCIGACSAGQSPHRQRTSDSFFAISKVESTNLVAWTQYGMFRREIFSDGIRFDVGGPFTGPGWGFEDNDLAFQMEMKGYANQRFFGMTYLHRDARSSIRIMKKLSIDAQALYARRKEYVIRKWAGVSGIEEGPLRLVRAVNMPV